MHFKISIARKFHISTNQPQKNHVSPTFGKMVVHLHSQPQIFTHFLKNQPQDNSPLPIFGETFQHLSRNSKIN